MRKLAVFNLISLDGFIAGQNGAIDWHCVDDEFNNFSIEQLKATDLLLFGRVTYQLMAGFWPTPEAQKSDPVVADKMNAIEKIVFSRTLTGVDWYNTRLVADSMEDVVAELKEREGKEIVIFGSGTIVSQLTERGLIDEYRLMVNPVILGKGKSQFDGLGHVRKMKLVTERQFNNGNMLLVYQPER